MIDDCGKNVMSIKSYIKYKLKVLEQLEIILTPQQEEHLRSLKREIDIDNYCHSIIMNAEEE